MGLDQYAYVKKLVVKDDLQKERDVILTSWRKHNRLQGWKIFGEVRAAIESSTAKE